MLIRIARWSLISLFGVSALGFAFAVGYALHDGDDPAQQGSAASDADPFAVLNEIYAVLKEDFVNKKQLNEDVLVESAVNGLLGSLGDPHTVYIDPQSYQLGRGDASGRFEGIGATVRRDSATGAIIIARPFTDSPAERAGIRPGDVVLKVDGQSTSGWSVQEAQLRIRGARGTTVRLTVRHSDGKQQDLDIVRDEILVATVLACPAIKLPSGHSSTEGIEVFCPIKDAQGQPAPDLLYLRIDQFTDSTAADVTAVLRGIDQSKYRGIILDVRGNPGGLLSATVDTVDIFLGNAVVLVQENVDGSRQEFRARTGTLTTLPIAVLQDGQSASGSEVLSAALRDGARAVLIGQKTFGKGTVNQLRPLPNGGALYVSIARWLTPAGVGIEGRGVAPDIEVIPTNADFDAAALNPDWDPQLFRAIQYLRNR
ncbi:MAG: S41 family peptidase [Dehalococcoidia bacterium]|nr:S41 family peptidase [Dehalococcoidia bacterium]